MEIIEKTAQTGAKGNLSKRQKQFLPLYLELKHIKEACRIFGIDRKTFYCWMKQPAFAAEIDRLQTEQVSETIAMVKMNLENAALKLVTLLDSKDESIVHRSSVALLDYYQKNIEAAELEKRLRALEMAGLKEQ